MAHMIATNVSVQLPIFSFHSLNLKKNLLRISTGGRIHTDSKVVTIEALRNVNFSLVDGDRVGLIGPNGAGKTTLLRTMARVLEPTAGTLDVEGAVVPMLTTGVGMHEDASGWENLRSMGLYIGMTPSELDEKLPDIAEFTELKDYLSLPIFSYSAGMRTRLSFAVATAMEPEILLLDEAIGAGDMAFFDKAQRRLENFIGNTRIMVIASHSEAWIRAFCSKSMLLCQGRVEAFGPTDEVFKEYHAMVARGISL